MRLTCNDRASKVTFDFGRNFTERDAVRDVLNKLQSQGAAATTRPSGSPSSTPSTAAQTPKPSVAISAEERTRRQILLGKKEVRRLHATLVRSGAVSDETFWNAMKFRYKANGERRVGRFGGGATGGGEGEEEEDEGVRRESVRGVPSDAYEEGRIDTSRWENGIPNAAQRHLVFMQEGAVEHAYERWVGEMGESKFWEYFIRSSMAKRKNGMSKVETARTAEADAVFVPFQAREEEMEREEMERRVRMLDREIDMDRFDDHRTAHVTDGRGGAGEGVGWGRKRKVMGMTENLRLMKRVNRHGSLIVRGEGWKEKGEKGRPLEDLVEEEDIEFASLGVGEIGEGGVERSGNDGGEREDGGVVVGMGRWMEGWEANVKRFVGGVEGSGEVLNELVRRMKP